MSESKKRPVEAEDLYRLQLINDAQISPDGRQVIYCQARVERRNEKKYTNLWIVPTDGDPSRQITYGNQVDTHPRWSPDGQHLAFLSSRDDEDQQQIYVLPLQGGEARPLTDMKGEFKTFEWSPDGQLVCQFRKKDAEAVERDENEDKKELGIVARHITRTFFKLDGDGYLPRERWHIWTIDAESGDARQLTDSAVYDEASPIWSPAGVEIAFVSNRNPDPDHDPDAVDLFTIPAGGGPLRKIDTPIGPKDMPSYSPDGRWLAYIGCEGSYKFGKNDSLWIVPADGSGPAQNLTGHHDIHIGNRTLSDIADLPELPPAWSPDSQRLTFQVTRHGNTALYSIDVDGGDLQAVMDVEGVAITFTLDRAGRKLASHHADRMDPGQIWLKDLDENELRQLTRANGALMDELQLGEIEEIWFKGADDNDLQGWIMKPPDFDATRQYPSILEIHGGPWLQYGNLFMHEFYFLAANGYVVYFTNPRGGQGYGEAHSRAIDQNWGTVDYADLMAWADVMAGQSYIDEERMGVTGGSYGGYMTSWIIGHTDRFKAAVAQRVVSNALSFVGSSDFNWAFQEIWGNGRPIWEDFEIYWRQSPMAHIGNATTPTLVIHSEQDMRCDLEQGLQVYVALKQLGVDTELVLFPEESHGLSRGGRTDRRVARLEHTLRWFDKYLNRAD